MIFNSTKKKTDIHGTRKLNEIHKKQGIKIIKICCILINMKSERISHTKFDAARILKWLLFCLFV